VSPLLYTLLIAVAWVRKQQLQVLSIHVFCENLLHDSCVGIHARIELILCVLADATILCHKGTVSAVGVRFELLDGITTLKTAAPATSAVDAVTSCSSKALARTCRLGNNNICINSLSSVPADALTPIWRQLCCNTKQPYCCCAWLQVQVTPGPACMAIAQSK
jgi:hypothetical protein